MKNNKILMFAVIGVLLVSMAGLVMAKADDKTNLAVKSIEISSENFVQGERIDIIAEMENKFGYGDAIASFGMSIDGPSSGSGFGTCCITLSPKNERGVNYIHASYFIPRESGEYTITASISPQNKVDVNPKDNTRTITFVVE